MRSYLIFLGIFISINCSAQTLGDLLKELKDATQKVKQNRLENSRLDYSGLSNAGFELAFDEISEKLKGRWVADSNSNCSKNILSGTNFIKGNDGSFKLTNFDENGKLDSDTVLSKIEKLNHNEETYLKLIGTRWFAAENKEYRYELIIVFSGSQFSILNLKLENNFLFKDGYFTKDQSKSRVYYKCQNSNLIVFEKDANKNNKGENFGVKGLNLGLPLPAEYQRLSEKNCKFELNKSNESVGVCYFTTTILELQYITKVYLVNSKIFAVEFIDLITKSENELNTNIKIENGSLKYYSATPPNLRPLQKIRDFSMYANDVISNIINATGDNKNTPDVSKNVLDHNVFNGQYFPPPSLARIFNWEMGLNSAETKWNENQKRFIYEKTSGYSDLLLKFCKNFCKLRGMEFKWNLNNYEIEYSILYPDSITMPYPLYGSFLEYKSKSLLTEAKKISESIQYETKEKLDKNTILSIDRINEIERQKNELRKKDF